VTHADTPPPLPFGILCALLSNALLLSFLGGLDRRQDDVDGCTIRGHRAQYGNIDHGSLRCFQFNANCGSCCTSNGLAWHRVCRQPPRRRKVRNSARFGLPLHWL